MPPRSRKIPSEFVPLDINYAHDRAVVNAGPMAELLFVRSMAYSRGKKSHGFLPDFDLAVAGRGVPNLKRHAAALVREGLWVEEEGGWRIRSWSKWNGTAAENDIAAEQHAVGAAKTNHQRWHVDKGRVDPACDLCTESL